ncbi:MAG: hypothetical protein AB7W16_05610 [Candidatus Obscuribacterales bacterium]
MNIEVRDIPGISFRMNVDDFTGSINELEYEDLGSSAVFLIRKAGEFPYPLWKAVRVREAAGQPTASMTFPKYIADLRFDEAARVLTLADRNLEHRWIINADGSLDFFGQPSQTQRLS